VAAGADPVRLRPLVEHPVPGNHVYESAPNVTPRRALLLLRRRGGRSGEGLLPLGPGGLDAVGPELGRAGLHAHARRPSRRLLAGVLRGGQHKRRGCARSWRPYRRGAACSPTRTSRG
jgi:hypothetical protein